jgi:hypothetical protein
MATGCFGECGVSGHGERALSGATEGVKSEANAEKRW